MAEGGDVPKYDTDENTGLHDSNCKISKKMNEILNTRGLSEDSVAKRRHIIQLLNIAHNIPNDIINTECMYYLSGSAAEGLVSVHDKTSDVDFMNIYPYNVISSVNEVNPPHHFPVRNGVYVLEDSISHPLFKRLRHDMGGYDRELYQHNNGYSYLSHAEIKREMYFNALTVTDNLLGPFGIPPDVSIDICGPSVNAKAKREWIFSYVTDVDMVVTVLCPFWPREINQWFVRERGYKWPSSSDIQTIKSSGCHLVGKGFDNSAEYEIEWRISFSMAETTLVKSFNNTQLKCYYLMKTLLKRMIKSRYPNVLCSYHMKTVMFWVCEETSPSFFKEHPLINCFYLCINKLRSFLLQNHFQCYFKKDVNLLKNHANAKICIEIAEFLHDVTEQGVFDLLMPYLKDQPVVSELIEKGYGKFFGPIVFQTIYFWKIDEYVKSIERVNDVLKTQNFFMRSIFNFIQTIFSLLRLDLNCIQKVAFNRVITDVTSIGLGALFKSQKNNKDHYKLQKHYLSMQSCDVSAEFSASVLKRASVYYKLGKINECMVLAVNVIENLSPCNVFSYSPGKEFNFLYISTKSCESFRMSPCIIFSPLEVTFVPEFICLEMDIDKYIMKEDAKGWACIDSIIYAYSLVILCQHCVSDFSTRNDFLQQLRQFYLKRKFELCYPETAKRAINYFYEKFYIP